MARKILTLLTLTWASSADDMTKFSFFSQNVSISRFKSSNLNRHIWLQHEQCIQVSTTKRGIGALVHKILTEFRISCWNIKFCTLALKPTCNLESTSFVVGSAYINWPIYWWHKYLYVGSKVDVLAYIYQYDIMRWRRLAALLDCVFPPNIILLLRSISFWSGLDRWPHNTYWISLPHVRVRRFQVSMILHTTNRWYLIYPQSFTLSYEKCSGLKYSV